MCIQTNIHNTYMSEGKTHPVKPAYLVGQVCHEAAAGVQLRPVWVAAARFGADCLGHQVQGCLGAVGADAVQPHTRRGPLPPLLQHAKPSHQTTGRMCVLEIGRS